MSGPLVPAASSSDGFTQTGTVNWVDLSSKTVEFALGALSRYSKAGIDPATVAMGQAVCKSFNLPLEVKKKILERIDKLPQVSMYGSIARFGFGLQHILQDLAERDSGISCIALCACLKESYDSFYGAQVLRFLCRAQNAPEEMTPGTQRWVSLLKASAGLFSDTAFSRLVDGLTRFVHPRMRYGVAQLGATEPESLAKSILLLAKISSGEIESCTVSGGIDCGWLGAVANFIFDLSVSVKQADGVVPYQTSTGRRLWNGESQVTILQPAGSDSNNVEIVQRSFYLPSGRSLFRESALGLRGVSQFESRSQWSNIISDSFGFASEDLLKGPISKSFARLLTYVARRQSTARQADLFTYSNDNWPDLQYGPHGPKGDALLVFAYERLPELRPCLEDVKFQKLGEISEFDAVSLVQQIQRSCACPACSGKQVDVCEFTCLLGVAGAIMHFIGLLSVAKVGDLLPTPFGLRQLYERSKPTNKNVTGRNARWEHKWPVNMSNALREIFELFSTPGSFYLIDGAWEARQALAAEGVCCFYGFLANIQSHPLDVASVYVIPGYIEHGGAMYERIEDIHLENEMWSDFVFPLPREYGFSATETQNSAILQVSCTTKTPSIPPAIFQAGRVVWWASHRQVPLNRQCDIEVVLPNYCGPYIDNEEDDGDDYYEESIWQIHFVEDAGRQNIQNQCCTPHKKSQALFSLLLIISNGDACNDLTIHKTSTDLWKLPKTSFDQFYAEFGKSYQFPLDKVVHYEIAELSDCPRCILHFAAQIWPRSTGPYVALPPDRICGRVIVHKSDDSTLQTEFELIHAGVNQQDIPVAAPRTVPVGRNGAKKSFPPLKPLKTPLELLRGFINM